MKPIGGYFELELAKGEQNYHEDALALKSGRAAMLYIIQKLKPSKFYVPYYTCDGLIDPIVASGVKFEFYSIDDKLEAKSLPTLKVGEYFIYVNYFDLKRHYTRKLSEELGDKLIVDCTQAFFMKGNGRSWFFNSCRKYFGTPDGSHLYTPDGIDINESFEPNEEYTTDHLVSRFNGDARKGYKSFLKNEQLCGIGLKAISKLSEYLLSHIDYESIIQSRRENFQHLQSLFDEYYLSNSETDNEAVPMFYPVYREQTINRQKLSEQNLFIPTFWADVLSRKVDGFVFEEKLTNHLLPLPIDHRYAKGDMDYLARAIKNLK